MAVDASGNCWHCGQALGAADYGREGRCPTCSKPTHACRNCRFYDPNKHNNCAEPVAEAVADKERSNFCGYFEADQRFTGDQPGTADDLLKAAEELFK